jgi:hypothetical protein
MILSFRAEDPIERVIIWTLVLEVCTRGQSQSRRMSAHCFVVLL